MKKRVVIFSYIIIISSRCFAGDGIPTFHYDNQHTGRTDNTGPESPGLSWTFRANSSFHGSPTIGEDGTIYVASNDTQGSYVAVTRYSSRGSVTWKFTENIRTNSNRVISSPAIDEERGQLYVGVLRSDDGRLYAIHTPVSVREWGLHRGAE